MKTLKQLRLDQELTQQQLADRAKVSRRVVNRAEAGAPIMPLKFAAICRALGVSRDAVVGANVFEKEKRGA